MAAPATGYSSALTALLFPWEVYNQVSKESCEKFYKITDLAGNALKAMQHLNVDKLHPTLGLIVNAKKIHESFTVMKYFGKINQSNGLLRSFFNPRAFWTLVVMRKSSGMGLKAIAKATFPIFFPTNNAKHPCYNARTDGLPFKDSWKQTGLYAVKILHLTGGAVLQTYLIASKIFFPELLTKVGPQVVQSFGLVAAGIGGQNVAIAAKVLTNIGATTIKNYCFMIFLAFEAYQGLQRFSNTTANTATSIDLGLKVAASTGKVLILASLVFFNTPTAVIVGISLVVCWIDLSEVYQKSLMESEKKAALIKLADSQAKQIQENNKKLDRYKKEYDELEDSEDS